jgi:RNA polymerase sigma-70 factor (ECF subfamily)
MGRKKQSERLSRIRTRWTIVFQAHQGNGAGVTAAQQKLLLRYYRPVYRYLRAMVRDGDTAEELTHEFVVRFLRGDFKRADPSRGRFRDLLKLALRHLAIDYWRRQRRERAKTPFPLPTEWQGTAADSDWHRQPPPPKREPAPDLDSPEFDRTFLRGWRDEVLLQAWRALARFEDRTGCSYLTVLRLRAKFAKQPSAELARLLGAHLGKPLSDPAFRQLLRRARAKFADLLVAEVARSLATSDPDAVEAELIELDLLFYCRRAVARLREADSLGQGRRLGSGTADGR